MTYLLLYLGTGYLLMAVSWNYAAKNRIEPPQGMHVFALTLGAWMWPVIFMGAVQVYLLRRRIIKAVLADEELFGDIERERLGLKNFKQAGSTRMKKDTSP